MTSSIREGFMLVMRTESGSLYQQLGSRGSGVPFRRTGQPVGVVFSDWCRAHCSMHCCWGGGTSTLSVISITDSSSEILIISMGEISRYGDGQLICAWRNNGCRGDVYVRILLGVSRQDYILSYRGRRWLEERL